MCDAQRGKKSGRKCAAAARPPFTRRARNAEELTRGALFFPASRYTARSSLFISWWNAGMLVRCQRERVCTSRPLKRNTTDPLISCTRAAHSPPWLFIYLFAHLPVHLYLSLGAEQARVCVCAKNARNTTTALAQSIRNAASETRPVIVFSSINPPTSIKLHSPTPPVDAGL